jgi:hypothetical protein
MIFNELSPLRYEAEVERASAELAKLSYRDGAFEELEEKHRNLRHEVNAMKQQVSIQATSKSKHRPFYTF